jgi:hypothetical protein
MSEKEEDIDWFFRPQFFLSVALLVLFLFVSGQISQEIRDTLDAIEVQQQEQKE